jgi:V8-like Glu-specific endopeptidase
MGTLAIGARRAALAAAAAVLAAAPAVAVGQPAAAAGADAHTTPAVSAAAWRAGRAQFGRAATAAQAVEAYWTPARMRAATVIEDSPAYLSAVARYQRDQRAQRAGAAGSAPAARQATGQRAHSVAPRAGAVTAGAVPAAFDPGFSYWQPTARTSGKVFFSMNGLNYQCSGTVVNSEGGNTVWTAGHCVNQGNGSGVWATNWQFVPAYDDDLADPRPYGTWTAWQLWTKTGWANSSDFSDDMGVALMNTRLGYHIVRYLGGQGLRVNAGRHVYEYAFGYPAEGPFDGGNLYRCEGSSTPEWQILWLWSETIKIPCDLTRGSSGGGWLLDYDGDWGYLNGLNSRIDRIVDPTIMASPYFDDDAWSLYNSTRYL